MSTVRIHTNRGPMEAPIFYRRGLWAVTPHLDSGLRFSEHECRVTHIPTGLAAPWILSSDEAINLCRFAGEAADVEDVASVLAAKDRFAEWKNRHCPHARLAGGPVLYGSGVD